MPPQRPELARGPVVPKHEAINVCRHDRRKVEWDELAEAADLVDHRSDAVETEAPVGRDLDYRRVPGQKLSLPVRVSSLEPEASSELVGDLEAGIETGLHRALVKKVPAEG